MLEHWNSEDSPQGRLALVARELARLNINIAALSEVRFAEQGSLTEVGAGYILFWSGKSKDERHLSGVGFMIKIFIARKLRNLPVGHSDCIMSLRLPIQDNKFALVLVLPRPEKSIAFSSFPKGAIFRKAYFAEGSDINVQPS